MLSSENEILKAARRGVEEAFYRLFERHVPMVYWSILLKIGDDLPLATVATENIFWTAFSSLSSVKEYEQFSRLVFYLASCCCAQIVQKQLPFSSRKNDSGHPLSLPSFPALPRETLEILSLVRSLPENQQLPLLLHATGNWLRIPGITEEEARSLCERGKCSLEKRRQETIDWKKSLAPLVYPAPRIHDFMAQWRKNITGTMDCFIRFFIRFWLFSMLGLSVLYLIFIFRVPIEDIHSFSVIFWAFQGAVLSILPFLYAASFLQKWYGKKRWKALCSKGVL